MRSGQPESDVLPTSYLKGLSSPSNFSSPAFGWLPDLFSESLHNFRSSRTPLSTMTVAYDRLLGDRPESIYRLTMIR
jgi:hypothetical protein